MSRLRVALICPPAAEEWRSIEHVGDMLLREFRRSHSLTLDVTRIHPALPVRAARLPGLSHSAFARNADRLLQRFVDYPRRLRAMRRDYDVFHLVEHSYGQLALEIPANKTVLTCHDLDTFRCVLDPQREPRPRWYRAMARRQMAGLLSAARVICVSRAVADELKALRLIREDRIRVIPNGVSPVYSPQPDAGADLEADRLLGPRSDSAMHLLHVGSVVNRKRIDVLLRVFAALRDQKPALRLVRVGGALTATQAEQARTLGIDDAIDSLAFVSQPVLAAIYRRAAAVLQPSDAEGFGLPVIEAMACGTSVVASDLPVFREVAGEAARYCTVGDIPAWVAEVQRVLAETDEASDARQARLRANLQRAACYSWEAAAASTAAVYAEITT